MENFSVLTLYNNSADGKVSPEVCERGCLCVCCKFHGSDPIRPFFLGVHPQPKTQADNCEIMFLFYFYFYKSFARQTQDKLLHYAWKFVTENAFFVQKIYFRLFILLHVMWKLKQWMKPKLQTDLFGKPLHSARAFLNGINTQQSSLNPPLFLLLLLFF